MLKAVFPWLPKSGLFVQMLSVGFSVEGIITVFLESNVPIIDLGVCNSIYMLNLFVQGFNLPKKLFS
jgi:hydrogenase/urease accessory protein HupE